uniref:OCIA domain-containing protein 1 n=1 Tax=Cyprinus carpio TaxID=7962 RepID=A0A8C1SH76_CYPCA
TMSQQSPEERRVFRECNQESFWYRSLPISVISMGFTQLLISRGALMASGRFGSLPKATCQEKFRSLENSPLGEALRQRQQPTYIEEDEQKKHMLYEELRRKNRENYEVTTPKPETLLKPSPFHPGETQIFKKS